MDSDYEAPILTSESVGGSRACPSGTIRRKGYSAVRRGKTFRVKSACIKDRGAPGRWQTVKNMLGIGPLRKGSLTSLGYRHTLPAAERHAVLDNVVRKYGRNSTIRKLNAIATYAKRTAPSRSLVYKTDMHYVQKKY